MNASLQHVVVVVCCVLLATTQARAQTIGDASPTEEAAPADVSPAVSEPAPDAVAEPASPDIAGEPSDAADAPEEPVAIEVPVTPEVAPAPLVPECAPGMRGCFLDVHQTWRAFDREYARVTSVPERHYGIAAVEELAFVGVGAIWYFAAIKDNRLDWDIESVRQRFSRESVRYDSNTFPMNFVLHPLSGSAYYGFPRANGLSVPASFVYGSVACLLWEFGLEFNERLSINDLLTTPIGGMAIGEFFNRFGRYLNSAPGGGSAWHKAFGYTLGAHIAFHDQVLDSRHGTPIGTVTDSLGYDAGIAHRFIVDAGFGVARTNEDASFFRYEVRVLADLIAIPGYLRPGTFGRFYGDANFTRFQLRGIGGPKGNGIELHADTVLLGYYAQNIREAGRGLRGFGLSVGSSIAYTYRRDDHAGFNDDLGITHLPGVAIDAHGFFGLAALHVRGRVHGDFAGVHSLAFPGWRSVNDGVGTRAVLERYGYYYGWGYSARIEAELELPYVTIGSSAAFGRYASHQGLDRAQEAIDASGVDVQAHDRVIDAEAFVRVRPIASAPLHVELAVARRRRISHLEEFSQSDRFERLLLRVGATF